MDIKEARKILIDDKLGGSSVSDPKPRAALISAALQSFAKEYDRAIPIFAEEIQGLRKQVSFLVEKLGMAEDTLLYIEGCGKCCQGHPRKTECHDIPCVVVTAVRDLTNWKKNMGLV